MKYGELIAFEPIDSVKVLREADDADLARRDVETFVISPQMSRMLTKQLLPHLRIDGEVDSKGILVVANYGTGKTHLMSVISSVLERAELSDKLVDVSVREAMDGLAGSFRVIRSEIGTTTMGLRDIVCDELEKGLAEMGVAFSFPPMGEVTNTKDSLLAMMAAYEEIEPDRGLLLVLDELLDYLRTRKDVELILDLQSLREIGEICRSTRFRFVAGLQEALFDNPRFASASEAVRRVRDRFEQVRISREDVSFVVQERLLRKNAGQKKTIRDHLQPFTPAFDGMAERLDEFVNLFPVHPAYLKTFEQVTLVEKRRVLTTLSTAMAERLDTDVPDDDPGLICFDSYRAELDADPSNRSNPDVSDVLDRAQVLRTKLQAGMAHKDDVPIAIRIVDALAVHRLTTEDIHVPIGLTVDELRDDLCLIPPGVPELDAGFIGTTLEATVDEILKAVSGQFISRDDQNGQLYLDVRKDIDYDQKIAERAEALDEHKLDDGYFRALEEVLEQRDAPYVASYRIWLYELPWKAKNVTRLGYLFMGAPNERSTAQPPRDFYVYFLQPYDPPSFVDEERADEAFVRLEIPDDELTETLRRYAGADALARESTEQHRVVYEQKRQQALQAMVSWLRQNMSTAMTVTYAGERKPMGTWLAQIPGSKTSVKAQIDAIAATALEPHFEERYPGYPAFGAEITNDTLDQTVQAAIGQIVTGRETTVGTKVLTSLSLVDGEGRIAPEGPFADALLEALERAGGKAVNRGDLLVERDPGLPSWPPWHLEPTWLVVVAAALCHAGRTDLGFPHAQIDALGLAQLTKMSAEDLAQFTHLAPPKALPVVALRDLASLLGLPKGSIPESGATEPVVVGILDRATQMLTRVVEVDQHVADGVMVWGALVVDQQAVRRERLGGLRTVLEDVKARDSVGKMNKLTLGSEQLDAARAGRRELEFVEAAVSAQAHLAGSLEYVSTARELFVDGDPFADDSDQLRKEALALFAVDELDAAEVAGLRGEAEKLKTRYREAAELAHRRDRLDAAGDEQKRLLLEGEVFVELDLLKSVEILPGGQFGSARQRLADIGSCHEFTDETLAQSVRCPHCGYLPRKSEGPTALAQVGVIEDELRAMRSTWEATLCDTLGAPEIAERIPLLKSGKDELTAFAESGKLPMPLTKEITQAINEVLSGFEVRNVAPAELFSSMFPDPSPATIPVLRDRFDGFIGKLEAGTDAARVRVVPKIDPADGAEQ